MKVAQILFFLMLLNLSFLLLNVTGIFIFNSGSGEDWMGLTLTELLLILVPAFAAAVTIGFALSKLGINPFVVAAYSAFLGTFVGLYANFISILWNVRNEMGEAAIIMDTFISILTIIMAVLILYTCIQMATGGAKGFE